MPVNRRAFLVSTIAAAGLALPVLAETSSLFRKRHSDQFRLALKKLLGSATPVDGRMSVDLPDFAENGAFVPITISVPSPMTEADHLKEIHILATANPVALIASFHLSPINAEARVQSRIRLAESEDVVTLAKLSTGEMLIATTPVKVSIGGCDT